MAGLYIVEFLSSYHISMAILAFLNHRTPMVMIVGMSCIGQYYCAAKLNLGLALASNDYHGVGAVCSHSHDKTEARLVVRNVCLLVLTKL